MFTILNDIWLIDYIYATELMFDILRIYKDLSSFFPNISYENLNRGLQRSI